MYEAFLFDRAAQQGGYGLGDVRDGGAEPRDPSGDADERWSSSRVALRGAASRQSAAVGTCALWRGALRIGGLAARGLAAALPGASDAFVRLSRRLQCVSRHARAARARGAPCMNAAKKHDHGVPGTRQHV